MAVDVVITGDKALDAKLAAMEPKLAKKAIRPALRDGAKVVAETAKALAPFNTGRLARSIKVRSRKRTRKGTIGINVSTGQGFFKGGEFYGAFQEHGTTMGSRNGKKFPRVVPARNYMKKAFMFTAAAQQRAIINRIRLNVEVEAPK